MNKLARAVTKRTKACDKRLARLISYIHHTSEYRQYCNVRNTAQHSRLGLFQDSDFARDLEDSKSTSRGILCNFESHTFVRISWMCKKQTSVSHSSTEADIISLDAGLRMDGIPALALWDLVIEVLHSVPNRTDGPKREPLGNPSAVVKPNMHNPIPIKHTNVIPTNIDHISPNTTHSGSNAMLYDFEDNEAVIKMIIKGRSPTMRHVSRTTELLWIRCSTGSIWNTRSKSNMSVNTKEQLADILTKGNIKRDEWNHLLHLFNIRHVSSTCCAKNSSLISCSKTMATRMQEQKGEEKSAAKSTSTAKNLSSHVPTSSSSAKSLIASQTPGILTATVKPENRMRRNSSQGMWIFPNLKLGMKKM